MITTAAIRKNRSHSNLLEPVLVGPLTSYSRPPQQVAIDYSGLEGLPAFAARLRKENAGQALAVERLAGFCLLARREVLDRLGGFDERFGVGFFDDDDLSVRVLQAGYRLLVARDVFVHHFGSRTFAGLGIDCQRQLRQNFERFRDKWGPEQAAGYRLPGGHPTLAGACVAPTALVPTGAAPRPRPKVSLCMIVRDEEENLHACLGSAADLVDEVVVVDTGSADRTKEVAARFGAKVFDFPWCDSFAAARNESLRRATGEWAFWLDADDRLDEENRHKLRALFAGLQDENVAYSMKCLCLADAGGTATVVDHLRLFRNHPRLRWEYRVHEQVLPSVRRASGEVRWADVVIRHAGYRDPALRRRKLDRDLRLLRLEDTERPDDPFTLFNLGSVYHELGRHAEALPLLCRSLERSHPSDSIVRKLYALLAGCHRALGQAGEALAVCRAGLSACPADAELLFLLAVLSRERGDRAGAKAALLELLAAPPAAYFASVDAGLRGHKARHNLALLYHEEGLAAEAEGQWRLAVAERPDFLPAWLGLGESARRQGRPDGVEEAARRLESLPGGRTEADVLRARARLSARDFAAARALLEGAVARSPRELWPRVILSHALLQEGRDLAAAEAALRAVLELDSGNAEARHNLAVLARRRQRAAQDEVFAGNPALACLYEEACRTPSDINEHLATLYALARECRHVTEMGTRTGVSTTALLYAQPEVLVCYDLVRHPQVGRLEALAGHTEFVFYQEDVLAAHIEETDLLFIDTWHVCGQLKEELRRHAGKARKYVVLHDTTTFGERGEGQGHKGLWPAVEELLAEGTFRLKRRYENNNGLTVLERARPGPGPAGSAPGDRLATAGLPVPLAHGVGGAQGPRREGQPDAPGRRAAGPTPPPRVAVISIVHNEEDLIAPFLEHYFGLGADAVLLVNNDCTDRTLERARRFANVFVSGLDSNGQLDDALRTETFQRYRESCAGRYDFVVLADADEFLVPKAGGDLKSALARHRDQSVLGSEGYDVVQGPGEPPYDPAVPLLRQRRWGVRNPAYGKPVVLRPECPLRLAAGQHFLLGPRPYPAVAPFYLLHFAGFDEALFLKRRLQMTARQGEANVRRGFSTQHTNQTEAGIRCRWQALRDDPRRQLLPTCAEGGATAIR